MADPFSAISPLPRIDPSVTTASQREALRTIFQGFNSGVWLVGGTALAGYYAQHRVSYDLDLFVVTERHHQATILAVKSLAGKGWELANILHTPNFFHVEVSAPDGSFTIDVVIDEHLHTIGQAQKTEDGVMVASLATLVAMKCACLISRCSEKDLYDLWWCLKINPLSMEEMILRGAQVDGGLNCEALLISVGGSTLRREACSFVIPGSGVTADHVFETITELKLQFIEDLKKIYRSLPPSERAAALKASKRDMK